MKLSREALIAEYATMHAREGGYGSGLFHLSAILAFLREQGATTVLDFGCGKGALLRHLLPPEFLARGYDPAVEAHATPPLSVFDAVVSTDVFEHFHPDHVAAELLAIRERWRPRSAFFLISTRPALFTLPTTGEQCHTVVRPGRWWKDQVAEAFPRHHISCDYLPARAEVILKLRPNNAKF